MQVKKFLIAFFLQFMLICVQCGPIPRSIGSGSYRIQAGTVTMQQAQKDICQATNNSVTFIYNVNLKYSITSYLLIFGFKKLNWQFDTNETVKDIQIYTDLQTPTYFHVNFISTFGSSIHEMEISYLAADSSLGSYIYFSPNNIIISSAPGAPVLPGNTLSGDVSSLAWLGYIDQSTTKVVIYCSHLKYNPGLATATDSFGIYLKLGIISTTSFNIDIMLPFGTDQFTQYQLSVVYFNQGPLYNIENILLTAAFLGTGDSPTVKSFSNTSMYTNSYFPNQGCDLTDNNTFIVIQPYFGSYRQMNFQLSLSGNSVFLAAQNYYAYNFSVISFCQAICSTFTHPFLYLLNYQCYDVCPIGLYGNATSTICEFCDSSCYTCQFSPTNCTSCSSGFYLYNNACGISCPPKMYQDSSVNQCLDCNENCSLCIISKNLCLSCIVNFFLLNSACYSECPIEFYEDTSLYKCSPCSTNCLNCTSSTQCYSCKSGSFLYNFECLLNCPNTTYGDSQVNECLDCNGTCYYCNIESTNCTTCINNTFLLNFNCYYDCPDGYYQDQSTGNCQACFSNCLTCTAANVCTKCISNHYLWPNLDKCQTSCPPNSFPNLITIMCDQIIIFGCISSLYFNNASICLQCNVSAYFRYVSSNKSCVCKQGYKLNNETCEQYCSDGIVNNMSCDDGNLNNGDGCSSQCTIENNFNCISVLNGPILISKCCYLPNITIQILSETKINGENTLKLILKVNPAPSFLTSNEIKLFLNIKIENEEIITDNLQIDYKNGIVEIYVPYFQDIQDKGMNLWTNFDPVKFCCPNIHISTILNGDNVALLYYSDLTLYKILGTFNFSMAIFVCIFALLSTYKHKMIGLQLIMPFQVILYSQAFYNLKTLQAAFYTSFKPVSFSIFTPEQMGSKNNSWYRIGMTGGFLQNYNFLGLLFLISTIFLVISMFSLQHGQRNRFKFKKSMRDWLNFGQFKILIRKYQGVIWKPFFVSFCLSTIPLIFSVSAKAMTMQSIFFAQTLFDVINDKCNYLFYILLMGGLFYTSIPRIFYNNKKNLLKKHIFKREGEKFKYDAVYCMYFQLHYLSIGFIYAYCPSTLLVLYTVSAINGLFFLYLIFKRPYESILDNVGAILSNLIVVYFLTLNLYIKITGTSQMMNFLSKISGLLITFLLFVQCIVAIVRLIIFWGNDKQQNLKGLTTDQKIDKFHYQRDKAFKNYIKGTTQQQKQQDAQFTNIMNQLQGQMKLNQSKTIDQLLIPKIYKEKNIKVNVNVNQNQNENNNLRDCIFNQTSSQNQKQIFLEQKYSSLNRFKNNLRESLKNYKLEHQKDQRLVNYYQNQANNFRM